MFWCEFKQLRALGTAALVRAVQKDRQGEHGSGYVGRSRRLAPAQGASQEGKQSPLRLGSPDRQPRDATGQSQPLPLQKGGLHHFLYSQQTVSTESEQGSFPARSSTAGEVLLLPRSAQT